MEDILDIKEQSIANEPDTSGIIRDEEGKFVKGHSGNLAGKPKGIVSPITRIKQIFAEDPTKFEAFVKRYMDGEGNDKHLVEMLDGKPKQTLAGDKENPLRIITIDKDLAELNGIIPTSEPKNHREE